MRVIRFVVFLILGFAIIGPISAEPITVVDSRGEQAFNAPPKRVMALTWALTEQVLELGIEPVGIADPDGYRTWAGVPALPEGVVDVGLRQEPSIEAIAELEPDVILLSDDQFGFVPHLEDVAPILHFENFSADHDNRKQAEDVFLKLGKLFGRQGIAEHKLTELKNRLATLRTRIDAHFDGRPPKVAIVRFIDDARVAIHGENAMPVFALKALGLDNAMPMPKTRWGITMKSIPELGKIKNGVVLYVEPFPQAEEVFSRPLWQAMPFVREDRFASMPAIWTYGGAMSIGHLADALADALLSLEAE